MHQPAPAPAPTSGSGSGSGSDADTKKKGRSPSISKTGIGQGVQCKWEMAPAAVDKGKVLLLLQIQQFVNDSRVRSKVIEVRSNGQETFVHEVSF